MKLVELEAIRDVRNLGRQGGDEDVGSLRELQPGVLAVRDRPVSEMKIAIMYKILLIFFNFPSSFSSLFCIKYLLDGPWYCQMNPYFPRNFRKRLLGRTDGVNDELSKSNL